MSVENTEALPSHVHVQYCTVPCCSPRERRITKNTIHCAAPTAWTLRSIARSKEEEHRYQRGGSPASDAVAALRAVPCTVAVLSRRLRARLIGGPLLGAICGASKAQHVLHCTAAASSEPIST